MSNMIDYVKWRGDISFDNCDFNEIDNIILSWLLYVDFKSILSKPTHNKITIKEAADVFFSEHKLGDILKKNIINKSCYELFKIIADTNRYKDIILSNYVERIDYDDEVQFGAITYIINKRIKYIVFRGTDDNIIGWKEDFKMGAMEEVPAQREAVNYLNRLSIFDFHKIYVGGHSKGGNLAVYGATKCNKFLKKKFQQIYNNDGPGFRENFISSKEYLSIVDKVLTFVPQSSVIGMLLGHKEQVEIIESSARGLWQHDPMTWNVSGNSFVRTDSTDDFSKFIDNTLKSWYDKMSDEERMDFIDTIFDILASTGATKISDFSDETFKKVNFAVKALSDIDKEKKKMISKVLLLIFYSGKEAVNIANPIKKILNIQKDGDNDEKVN